MYMNPDMSRWQGRVDAAEGVRALRWHQIMRPLEQAERQSGIALAGFACDAGVARNQGRTGARNGPAALRSALANLPVNRCTALCDAGDIVCQPQGGGDGLEPAQQELADLVASLLARNKLPLVMGGGHEVAFGTFSGLAQHLERNLAQQAVPRVGIINFDAHFDLRKAERASSGTPFRQIAEDCQARTWPFKYCVLGISEFGNTPALFERARQLGVTWLRDEDMHVAALDQIRRTLSGFIEQVDHVYLTICLDVLPAAVAPGVSAPAARGVGLEVVEPALDLVAASGKLRVADLAELNPERDIDGQTARVAARLLARIVERSWAARED